MNRRSFIKASVIVAIIAANPSYLLSKSRKFVTKEHGIAVTIPIDISKKEMEKIIVEELLPNAREHVGKDVVIEIRMKIPANRDRNSGIAWYTNKYVCKLEPEKLKEPIDMNGYIYCGRVIT